MQVSMSESNQTPKKRRDSVGTDAGYALRKYVDEISNPPATPPLDQSEPTLAGELEPGDSLSHADLPTAEAPKPATPQPDILNMIQTDYAIRGVFFEAVKSNNAALAESLISLASMQVDVRDERGRTPLSQAAEHDSRDVVPVLLRYGASLASQANMYNEFWERKFYSKRTPLHWAAHCGKNHVIQQLLDAKADVNAVNYEHRGPLQDAAMGGHVESVSLLISRGADMDNQDVNGWTALHEAARYGRFDLGRILLDAGANADIPNSDGDTPLILGSIPWKEAVAARNGKLLEKLAQKGNVNKSNHNQWTPMHFTAEGGWRIAVTILIEADANLNPREAGGDTPLMKTLRSAPGGPENLVRPGSLEIYETVECLLDGGADPDLKDRRGQSSKVLAKHTGDDHLYNLVLKHRRSRGRMMDSK